MPEREPVGLATALGQGRVELGEAAEPAEQMGIAAQFGESAEVREFGLEIGEEATGGDPTGGEGLGSQGGGESLNMGVQEFPEERVEESEGSRVRAAELGRALRLGREILGENQTGWQGMALAGQVLEQAAETQQVDAAGARGQGRMLLTQAAEPAEQMGIAAQFGELEHRRELGLEIGEEAMGGHAIEAVGSRESLELGVQKLHEGRVGR